MILAQALLQIFCWQGSIGIIPSNSHRILQKDNQVICIMYQNSKPDIMIQAQAVQKLFCWQDCFRIQMPKSEKGDTSAKYLQNFVQS